MRMGDRLTGITDLHMTDLHKGWLWAMAAALVLAALSGEPAAAGPFDELGGAWTGGGILNLREGSKERVRCKANYVVKSNGYSIDQVLTCASDAYKFEMTSNI